MSYPTAEDYLRAVQDPVGVFGRPELQRAQFAVHPLLGIPMPASGNAAVVFKARVADADTALRFFVRADTSSHVRYAALGRHFSTHGLTDAVATSDWVDNAITVNHATWPMLQMQWVEGRTLDSYVAHLAETRDVTALFCLAGVWRQLMARMQGVGFAHGDLQHGNVLVDRHRALRLVDFDGSWISTFAGGPRPAETGHPNYQRAGRDWGRWMDTFPGLVIYTSLLALSREPDLWAGLNDGESLIFRSPDYQPPFQTPVWRRLAQLTDPDLAYAVARLRECCAPGWAATASLEAVLRPAVRVAPSGPPVPPSGSWVPGPAPASTSWWLQAAPPPRSTGPEVMPPPPPKNLVHAARTPAFDAARARSSPRHSPPVGPVRSRSTAPGPGVWGTPGRPAGPGLAPRTRVVSTRPTPSLGVSVVLAMLIGLLLASVGVGVLSAAGAPGSLAILVWAVVSAVALPIVHRRRS